MQDHDQLINRYLFQIQKGALLPLSDTFVPQGVCRTLEKYIYSNRPSGGPTSETEMHTLAPDFQDRAGRWYAKHFSASLSGKPAV